MNTLTAAERTRLAELTRERERLLVKQRGEQVSQLREHIDEISKFYRRGLMSPELLVASHRRVCEQLGINFNKLYARDAQ